MAKKPPPPRKLSRPVADESKGLVRWSPLNAAQKEVQALWPQADVLFLLGPAGSGKTLAAVALAATDVLANPRTMRLVGLRPAVECGRSLGHLPGTLDEKLAPFATPTLQALSKVAYHFPPASLTFEAISYLRGCTYENAVVLCDEAQNLTYKELKLVLTRIGRGSKLVLLGDPEQSDIRPIPGVPDHDYDTDLEFVVSCLEDHTPGVAVIDFLPEDVVRHPVIGRILKRLP